MKHIFVLFAFLTCIAASAQDDVTAFSELEVKPEYPGGLNAFYAYVGKTFRTPEVDQDVTLKVNVVFVVEKDGSLSGVQAESDPGYGFAQEAVRVVKGSPKKWVPGQLNGKPVRATYTLPIVLKIQVTPETTPKETD